jgi:hypothetical protein
MNYSVYNAHGRIIRIITFPPGVDPSMTAGAGNGFVEGLFDSARYYVSGGVAVLRPEISVTIRADGAGVIADPCPVGAVVTVIDAETEVVFGEVEGDGGTLEIELPDAGEYIVKVSAPFPWIASEPLRVTV